MQHIIISGRIPSKKNSRCLFVRGGKMMNIPSKKYKEWHVDASEQLQEYKRTKPLQGPLSIDLSFWAPDKRKTDLTNKAESILDLLVDNGILADDNWYIVSEVVLMFEGVDKDNPRCEIDILRK